MELRLEGPSYTSDTLERYNQRGYERHELFFVVVGPGTVDAGLCDRELKL